ncbi:MULTISPECIES: hypothetical protein [Fusobacterium]|uniref:hypothetical protein n=1 Tax=Fusobacterium TaxID=848 RepID=UPI001032F268|nr:hypothetical protein [Fusobacterium ulcerans]
MLILKRGEFEKKSEKYLERAHYEDVIIENDSSKVIAMSLDKYIEIMRELRYYKEHYHKESIKKARNAMSNNFFDILKKKRA